MNLSAHGSYSLNFENNILHVNAEGPFNEEVLKKYHQDMKKIVKKHNNKRWAALVVYNGNGIFTPDAETELIEVTKFRAKNGMIANASVLKESVHADLQQTQLTRIYQTAKIRSHFFSDEHSAKNWLTEFLKESKTTVR
jgi:uncharacterized protein YfkK (UPF0435 family)